MKTENQLNYLNYDNTEHVPISFFLKLVNQDYYFNIFKL